MAESTCTRPGCDKKRVARGYCKTHYNLWHRANQPAQHGCSIEECNGKHYSRGWCAVHYSRWRKTGTVDLPAPRLCDVDDCGGQHHSRGYCRKHWERWRRHGDSDRVDRGGFAHPRGEQNPKWIGDRASYNAVHNRLRRARGTPLCCQHCGSEGNDRYQWALDWSRATEIRYWEKCRRGHVEMLPYSVNPGDYVRLCVGCHRRFDVEHMMAAR